MNEFEEWRTYFIQCRQPSLISFYESILGNKNAASNLVAQCRDLHSNRKPLRKMNLIERLGSLSHEMASYQPPRTALTVFLLVTCIEAIYALAEIGPKKKVQIVIEFFKNYVSCGDQEKLFQGIRRSLADDSSQKNGTKLTIEAIARLINKLRNLLAHEGVDWVFSFSGTGESLQQGPIRFEEGKHNPEADHFYDVTITLDEFSKIVLRGCTSFLQKTLGESVH